MTCLVESKRNRAKNKDSAQPSTETGTGAAETSLTTTGAAENSLIAGATETSLEEQDDEEPPSSIVFEADDDLVYNKVLADATLHVKQAGDQRRLFVI